MPTTQIFALLKKFFRKRLVYPPAPDTPTTFEEAVAYVARRIDADTVTSPIFHFTGGMAMRNALDLWNRNGVLHQHMSARFGLCHADDMGALIANAAHAFRNGETYDPEDDVALFKAHWRRMGLDPATMLPLGG